MNEAVEPVPKVDPIAKPHNNRSKWRSLRDFVDEPAIEDATERMESDRNALEVRHFDFRERSPVAINRDFTQLHTGSSRIYFIPNTKS